MASSPMPRPLLLALIAVSSVPALAAPTFKPQTIDASISIGYGLAISDVDGDKKDDILIADAKEIAWYHNPDWKKEVIARNLTPRDNVCIAARDINGDGKAEIAVGAQWNPGETSNEKESGAVFFLSRPATPGDPWTPVALPHEPTVHRMRWVRTAPSQFALVVLPLHGRGNLNGSGQGVKILALSPGPDPSSAASWQSSLIDDSLHITHNLDARSLPDGSEEIIVASKEGFLVAKPDGQGWKTSRAPLAPTPDARGFLGAGEVRFLSPDLITAVEPFHGQLVTVLQRDPATREWQRQIIEQGFNQGHALGTADFDHDGQLDIIAGWREPDAAKSTGLRLYSLKNNKWAPSWSSEPNTMACEDLKTADLNADGKPDIIAAGRASKNLVIYWNQTP